MRDGRRISTWALLRRWVSSPTTWRCSFSSALSQCSCRHSPLRRFLHSWIMSLKSGSMRTKCSSNREGSLHFCMKINFDHDGAIHVTLAQKLCKSKIFGMSFFNGECRILRPNWAGCSEYFIFNPNFPKTRESRAKCHIFTSYKFTSF